MYEKNQPEKDHFWKTSMRTLMARKIVIDIEEKLPGLLDEWYREHGLDTPPWRQINHTLMMMVISLDQNRYKYL